MSRAQKAQRKSPGKSAQRQPTAIPDGSKGRGVMKSTGTERPDPATGNPMELADPTARVIKTRS